MKYLITLLISIISYQGYSQINIDSAKYYLLINNDWIDTSLDITDSLTNNEIEWSKMVIDSIHYMFPDSQAGICILFPLKYELSIKQNIFQLHIKDKYLGLKFNFYIYGWFENESIMQIVTTDKKTRINKVKKGEVVTYKKTTLHNTIYR